MKMVKNLLTDWLNSVTDVPTFYALNDEGIANDIGGASDILCLKTKQKKWLFRGKKRGNKNT